MNRIAFGAAFGAGLLTVAWTAAGFVGHNPLALLMTVLIAAGYLLGAHELRGYRSATAALARALKQPPPATGELAPWLDAVPAALRPAVRSRIEGERLALPGPALTPYLVGLLVMLGMLGTFVGMVLTFQGAVLALEGSADLQAIRAALAAPIKGLGLSFGTSVAGVAASAALGLMSAMARRERADVARGLDAHVASTLRPFSLVHQRQETFKLLQQQAHALPEVASQLQALMAGLESRNQRLGEQLLDQQTRFHDEATRAYTELAQRVAGSLQGALVAGAQAAGDSLRPVVEQAMTRLEDNARTAHQRTVEATTAQLQRLASDVEAAARSVTAGWQAAQAEHLRSSDAVAHRVAQAFDGAQLALQTRSEALLSQIQTAAEQAQRAQTQADAERLQLWTQQLQTLAGDLQTSWQQASGQTLAQQQALCDTMAQTASELGQRQHEQLHSAREDMARLLAQSDEFVQAQLANDTAWAQQQAAQSEALTRLWRTELAALRQDESLRGDAAVARLGELQDALARQLATLGAALETPMTRLMQTASEVPQAAAEVIAQMRQEMTRLSERDNEALDERNRLVAQLGQLLLAVQHTTTEQRAAIEALVASAADTLTQAGERAAHTLDGQAERAADATARVNGSAIELASLAEAFAQGVQLFGSSNEQLMATLQRVESTLQQAMARSDEQLAYYVAQAREVIDLSITSQQGLLEDLQRLRSQPVAVAEGSAA